MNPTLMQALDRLRTGDVWTQIDAVHELARSGDPDAVAVVLELLAAPEQQSSEVVHIAADGLVEGAPATLTPVIERYLAAPAAPVGQSCAYALGEVAFRQGTTADPRIAAALIEGLASLIAAGTVAATPTVAALRECARATPLPSAAPLLRQLLECSQDESDPYGRCIELALEILAISEAE